MHVTRGISIGHYGRGASSRPLLPIYFPPLLIPLFMIFTPITKGLTGPAVSDIIT